MMRFIEQAKEKFTRIIATTPSDTFYSYFRDESRLADFRVLRIGTLTREQQEQLIRKRLEMMEGQQPVTDGRVDQEENAVNSVIISNKLIPRYPFYVLSILQTREAFMPNNLAVTSYGHCYHALIVARLIKAGISQKDEEVGACFNLAEQLSYETYIHKSPRNKEKFDFSKFIERYKEKFLINASTVNRLKNSDYGIIDEEGNFRSEYMYYYFLGEFIATHNEEGKPIIEKMCENSHIEVNYLTLLFAIHHARDTQIIDDIMLQTMCALDIIAPATLDREETKQFGNVLEELPKSILSKRSVIEERKKVRDTLPDEELPTAEEPDAELQEDQTTRIVNDVYRILKNNRIMADRRLVLPQRQVGCAYFALQDMTRPAVEPLSLQEVSQGFRVHSAIEGPLGFLGGRQGIPGELLLHACFPEQFRREGRCRFHRTWAGRFGLGGKGRVRRVGRPGRGGFHYGDGAADDQD